MIRSSRRVICRRSATGYPLVVLAMGAKTTGLESTSRHPYQLNIASANANAKSCGMPLVSGLTVACCFQFQAVTTQSNISGVNPTPCWQIHLLAKNKKQYLPQKINKYETQ